MGCGAPVAAVFQMTSAQKRPRAPAPPAEHVTQNVETIASLRTRAEGELSAHQRRIEWATAALGHPRSMYVILLLAAVWVAVNTGMPHLGLAPLDPPPFSYLQAAVGLAALLTTVMVLTTQNRQSKYAEQRDHLDLQVNLLAEQKVAKLIALVEELRRDIPSVPDRVDPIAEVMTEPLDPHAVVTAMEHTLVPPPEPAKPTEHAPSGVEVPNRRHSPK